MRTAPRLAPIESIRAKKSQFEYQSRPDENSAGRATATKKGGQGKMRVSILSSKNSNEEHVAGGQ